MTRPSIEPDGANSGSTPPPAPATHAAAVEAMLKRTIRGGVAIRSTFVQSPIPDADGSRQGPLAKFVSARAHVALKTYLLIHAMASASEDSQSSTPFSARYPSDWWIRALDLNNGAEDAPAMMAARNRLSKAVKFLRDKKLVAEGGRQSRQAVYSLLDESGDGRPYVRPRPKTLGTWTDEDENWFIIPHTFWTRGHVDRLGLPALAVLLIAMTNKPGFTLPAERGPAWYGLSKNTIQRGLQDLKKDEIIDYMPSWVMDVRIKQNNGWREVRKYSLKGQWSPAQRRWAMIRPRAGGSPDFKPAQAAPAATTVAESEDNSLPSPLSLFSASLTGRHTAAEGVKEAGSPISMSNHEPAVEEAK